MIQRVYENETAENSLDFMNKSLAFFLFEITNTLTDKGIEFTNRLLISKTSDACQKPSKLNQKCIKNNIRQLSTAPFTPETSGMVEHVNGIIKKDTILRTKYNTTSKMKINLMIFLKFCKL